MGDIDSGNPAGSGPPDPIPQEVGSRLQLSRHESNHEPIRRTTAGFGIVTHVGRKSGKVYRTPVNVFRTPEGFLTALTYGRESEWARNVIAAGGCKLETRGTPYNLSAPTIVSDPTRRRFPLLVRMVLRLIGATDFMQLSSSRAQL
jgi:deazaflavin-dependent oxidoreductase (nitroreductase family)